MGVSIHAPAWGATQAQSAKLNANKVSIHAPAWGATVTFRFIFRNAISFNPRARVGRDRDDAGSAAGRAGFNPRARVGRDNGSGEQVATCSSFNPRARVGRDHRAKRALPG